MIAENLSPQAQTLIDFIAEQGYICPWGQAWDGLWKMLPNRKRVGETWEPALPLILSGWYISGDLDKALLFREHIDWADRHGVINKVDEYLRGLPSESWHKRKPSTNGGGEMNPLARATEAYIRERIAAGYTVTEIKPTPSNTMQATFVPRRRPVALDDDDHATGTKKDQ